MSESLKHGGEHKTEAIDLVEQSRKNLERIREKAENSAEKSPEDLKKVQKSVETQAVSGKELSVGENESTSTGNSTSLNQKEIKLHTYNKTMRQVRRKLTKSERVLSKVVHNKPIEAISDVSSKTVARPSGIVGGGIAALCGSLFLLYMTKNYGFEYNYFLFVLFFVGGFFIGMTIEALIRLGSPKQ